MGGRRKSYSVEGRQRYRTAGLFLVGLLLILLSASCSSKPKVSSLIRDPLDPPKIVREVFVKDGKSDYFLSMDEGYSFRLIYLCENRVLNFIEEPPKNPVLVSIQPILDTPVEKKLSPDDRRRVWACMERKVWEEQSRIDELKRRVMRERIRMERELRSAWAERDRILAAIAEKKRIEAERQRRREEERRKAEEERLRKMDEEQRRKAEEERKVRFYRAEEKEEPSPPPQKGTESGVFLVMKEARVFEQPKDTSKILSRVDKYDLFEVVNSKRDEFGSLWYQILLSERVISEKGKKTGWSPEERSFWVKNKLPVWVYPGDIANFNHAKPLKIRVEDVHFTGKVALTPQKHSLFEVTYVVRATIKKEVLGWVEEKDGIRRHTKTIEEMRDLLRDLSRTLWPLRIQEDVLRGYIRQGFTREQVVLSWGRPDHVNTTRTLVGVHEQWVYGETPFPRSYVYFENGLVKSWEFFTDSRRRP